MLRTLRTPRHLSASARRDLRARYEYEIPDNYERALASAGYIRDGVPLASWEDYTDCSLHLPSRKVAT